LCGLLSKFVGAIRRNINGQVADFVDEIIRYIYEKILGNKSREAMIEDFSKDVIKKQKK
jgi:hypothetical protein